MRTTHHGVVVARSVLTAHMVRLTLAGPSLVGVVPRPAQDIEVLLTDGTERRVKRRYTIRHARPERGEWDVDVMVHDAGGPGSRWAADAQLGSNVEFMGPRGKLELRPAGHHLFVGDEASLPAIGALTEALPPTQISTAIVQIASAADKISVAATTTHWLTRDGLPAETVDLLLPAVKQAIPGLDGAQVYLLCESRVSRTLRDLVLGSGFDHQQVFAKGYWNRPDTCTDAPVRS